MIRAMSEDEIGDFDRLLERDAALPAVIPNKGLKLPAPGEVITIPITRGGGATSVSQQV